MPMKSYASFDKWAADQSLKHRKLIKALQSLVESAAPKLTETVKWGNGCYTGNKNPVIYLYAGENDHLQLGFFHGFDLSDPKDRLEGSGKFVRHIKIRSPRDIDKVYFTKLVKEAVGKEVKANPVEEGIFSSLSKPAQRALANAKIETLQDLAKYSEKEVLAFHGVGPSAIPKLRAALKKAKLSFRREGGVTKKSPPKLPPHQ